MAKEENFNLHPERINIQIELETPSRATNQTWTNHLNNITKTIEENTPFTVLKIGNFK